MRIAIVNRNRLKIGGVETYLDTAIGAIATAGHQVGFLSEMGAADDPRRIRLPEHVQAWCAEEVGLTRALAALRSWRPDVIYAHLLSDPRLEAQLIEVAPAVLFDHGYNGTCISGNKMLAAPRPWPCARRFGWQCLIHYYPHRCGGLNPVRMWTEYRSQTERLAVMRRYAVILTASSHMRGELMRHCFAPDRVHILRYPLAPSRLLQSPVAATLQAAPARDRELKLLFVGRMTGLKGGAIMLDALPLVAASLKRPLKVTYVGDGPDRVRWQQKALRAQAASSKLNIEFTGWLDSSHIDQLMLNSDLLVVPSTWPEPFGLVGPEAGLHGLPAAAFAVGGIPEWLSDGVSGRLAPGDPPSAAGLTRAIVECVRDPAELARLGRGAQELASRFYLKEHIDALLAIFEEVAGVNAAALARTS